MALRLILEKVVVADPLRDYAVRLVLATHPQSEFAGDTVRRFVKWGASPARGASDSSAQPASALSPRAVRTWPSRTSAISPRCARSPRAAQLRRTRGESERAWAGG
jgi:hypothetical protein